MKWEGAAGGRADCCCGVQGQVHVLIAMNAAFDKVVFLDTVQGCVEVRSSWSCGTGTAPQAQPLPAAADCLLGPFTGTLPEVLLSSAAELNAACTSAQGSMLSAASACSGYRSSNVSICGRKSQSWTTACHIIAKSSPSPPPPGPAAVVLMLWSGCRS